MRVDGTHPGGALEKVPGFFYSGNEGAWIGLLFLLIEVWMNGLHFLGKGFLDDCPGEHLWW